MRLFHLFEIIAVLALVLFLFASAEGRGGDSYTCFFVGYCEFDEEGIGYRYYQCTGSFAPYSNWRVDSRCQMPGWKPRIPLENIRTLPASVP